MATDTLVVVFFFSSRRRHTRCSRDWSSDVCSSDLVSLAKTLFSLTSILSSASNLNNALRCTTSCARGRSEEHTSELQSRLHLVCRLLLEKKKNTSEYPNNTEANREKHASPDLRALM